LTQEEVAKVMAVSRAKVIRLLAAARDHGIVRIRIDAKGSDQLALERGWSTSTAERAVVAPAPADKSAVAAVVGHATGPTLRTTSATGCHWASVGESRSA
jgi:DNA-binding transcriptional regulator LsrR (DeoR family)